MQLDSWPYTSADWATEKHQLLLLSPLRAFCVAVESSKVMQKKAQTIQHFNIFHEWWGTNSGNSDTTEKRTGVMSRPWRKQMLIMQKSSCVGGFRVRRPTCWLPSSLWPSCPPERPGAAPGHPTGYWGPGARETSRHTQNTEPERHGRPSKTTWNWLCFIGLHIYQRTPFIYLFFYSSDDIEIQSRAMHTHVLTGLKD